MPAVNPFILGAELEMGKFRVFLDSVYSSYELVYIYANNKGPDLSSRYLISLYKETLTLLGWLDIEAKTETIIRIVLGLQLSQAVICHWRKAILDTLP